MLLTFSGSVCVRRLNRTGSKFLRLFDIKSGNAIHTVPTARGAYHLAVDHHSKNLVASFSRSDHAIKIWDMRQFQNPVYAIDLDPRTVIDQLSWCPTRPGLLGALSHDSNVVKVYDMHLLKSLEIEKDVGHLITQRTLPATAEPLKAPLAHFSWHPQDRNRMIAISTQGVVQDFTLHEQIAVDMSPKGHLMFSNAEFLMNLDRSPKKMQAEKAPTSSSASANDTDDISVVIRRRLMNGYGLNISKNLAICCNVPQLSTVWKWLHIQQTWSHAGGIIGLQSALQMDAKSAGRTIMARQEYDATSQQATSTDGIASYDDSVQRKLGLMICGWEAADNKDAVEAMVKSAEDEGHYERAAALAVFHQNIHRGIQALITGSQATDKATSAGLLSAAMTLSGYKPAVSTTSTHVSSMDTMWKDTCKNMRLKLPSPYLRALLGFLTCSDGLYKEVLDEENIQLLDRLGFACRYLSEDELETYFVDFMEDTLSTGSLVGLTVKGFGPEGMDIMSRFVDKTSDIQSASMLLSVALQSLSPSSSAIRSMRSDNRVNMWIEEYRELLDRWQLWLQRAQFDVDRQEQSGVRSATTQGISQIYVRCTFCSNSIMPSKTQRKTRTIASSRYHEAASRRAGVMACPSCRKALPRCAICLMHLGAGNPSVDGHVPKAVAVKKAPFEQWFTWCQTCRHGGHATCMGDWFKHHNHNECPVSNCDCKCSAHDCVGSGIRTRQAALGLDGAHGQTPSA